MPRPWLSWIALPRIGTPVGAGLPETATPAPVLKAMGLPAPAEGPPIVLLLAWLTRTPAPWLARFSVPVVSVPIWLPAMRLPEVFAPRRRIPSPALPLMTLPAPDVVPPMVLLALLI